MHTLSLITTGILAGVYIPGVLASYLTRGDGIPFDSFDRYSMRLRLEGRVRALAGRRLVRAAAAAVAGVGILLAAGSACASSAPEPSSPSSYWETICQSDASVIGIAAPKDDPSGVWDGVAWVRVLCADGPHQEIHCAVEHGGYVAACFDEITGEVIFD